MIPADRYQISFFQKLDARITG